MKTSENDAKYNSLNIGEMDKSRELYSKEGDNSNRFEGKTVPWEHTMGDFIWNQSSYYSNQSESNLRHLNFDPYPSRTRGGP